jgi:hypothetical protein
MKKNKVDWVLDLEEDIVDDSSSCYDEDLTNEIINKLSLIKIKKKNNKVSKMRKNYYD